MKVSAQLRELLKPGSATILRIKWPTLSRIVLFEKLLKGQKNADQRTPGHQEGSAEIKRRIGKIKTRASVHKN
jgi:hypothetical protein